MKREYFAGAEAQEKVGKRIKTLREFSGVPEGTTGRVVGVDDTPRLGHSLIIEWDLPNERQVTRFTAGGEEAVLITGGKPLVDWFSRDEYENFLREEV